MNGLEHIRAQCACCADAIRWACVLEATAPKAGNVFPGRRFDDLAYADFVVAAEITADAFMAHPAAFPRAVEAASQRIRQRVGTNVNLGILLLIGPLAQAAASGNGSLTTASWRRQVTTVLDQLTRDDSQRLYNAIRLAAPGGMGHTDKMDVSDAAPERFLDAMESAAGRDRIAQNYASGFKDLFEHVVPLLHESLTRHVDLLRGISAAHLRMLSENPDTLITRKHGQAVAAQVQQNAPKDLDDARAVYEFDRFLRQGADQTISSAKAPAAPYNPGTTADLIAAALYVLLRLPHLPDHS